MPKLAPETERHGLGCLSPGLHKRALNTYCALCTGLTTRPQGLRAAVLLGVPL